MISFPNLTFSEIFSWNNSSNYIKQSYETSNAVLKLHSVVRGGNTDDITVLASNGTQDVNGYMDGVVTSSILLILLFFFWSLALVHFKYQHKQHQNNSSLSNDIKFSFLSGGNFNQEYYTSSDNNTCTCIISIQKRILKPMYFRILFILFCALIAVFSIIFTSKGAESVSLTTSSLQGNTNEISYMLKETTDMIDKLIIINYNMNNVSTFLSDNIGYKSNLCPNGNLTELLGEDIDTQDISKQINDINDDILNAKLLVNLKETLMEHNNKIVMHVNALMHNYNNGSTASASSPNYNWKPLLFVLPYVICSALFVVGVLLIYMEVASLKYQDFLSYRLLPVFIILILISTSLGIALRVFATINADTCMNPDYTIKQILTNIGTIMSNPTSSNTLTYILEGCNNNAHDNKDKNPLLFINKYQNLLEKSILSLSHFSTVMSSMDISRLNEYCNKDLTSTIYIFQLLQMSLMQLYQIILQMLSLYSCPNVSALYVRTVHHTVCTYSPDALRWMYVVLMGISISGWFMITLRSSYLINHFDNNDSSFSSNHESNKHVTKEIPDTPASFSSNYHDNNTTTPATDIVLQHPNVTPDNCFHSAMFPVSASSCNNEHAFSSFVPSKLNFDDQVETHNRPSSSSSCKLKIMINSMQDAIKTSDL